MMHKWFPTNAHTLSFMKGAVHVLHVSVSPWCTYAQYVDGFYSNRISYSWDNCLHSEQQSPTSKADTQQVGGEHTAQTHTPSRHLLRNWKMVRQHRKNSEVNSSPCIYSLQNKSFLARNFALEFIWWTERYNAKILMLLRNDILYTRLKKVTCMLLGYFSKPDSSWASEVVDDA